VVPDQKVLCQITHGHGLRTGKALDGQERLVLLGRKPGPACGGLAERQKLSQLKTKLRKGSVIDDMSRALGGRFDLTDGRVAPTMPFRLKHPALRVGDDDEAP
jgi:hypothetical protein